MKKSKVTVDFQDTQSYNSERMISKGEDPTR